MFDILKNLLLPDLFEGLLSLLAAFAIYILAGLVPVATGLYCVYYLLTLPMRRNERARMFLDLLELGIQDGRTPEGAVSEAAASRDPILGKRFHRLAGFIAQGMRLGRALDQVPRLLPSQLVTILKAGETLGDVRKVIPACRLPLHDSVSQVRAALNYLLVLAFVTTPFMIGAPLVLRLKVLPTFEAVFDNMLEGGQLPPFTQLVLGGSWTVMAIQTVALLFVWFITLTYIGGPRFRSWVELVLPGGALLLDRVQTWFPWRRKRLERDFSAMLSLLLEAAVPEADAIRIAGESTGNLVFIHHAQAAVAKLKEGVKLPEAIRAVDDSGELKWRLANALRGAGFVRALSGWHETLDARAFQLEQTAAQVATTCLVLLNGLIVGSFVIGLFLGLIHLLNEATLW